MAEERRFLASGLSVYRQKIWKLNTQSTGRSGRCTSQLRVCHEQRSCRLYIDLHLLSFPEPAHAVPLTAGKLPDASMVLIGVAP